MSVKTRTHKPPGTQLQTWLDEQVVKLGTLVTNGWKIQADYLRNAKAKGEVLAEVRSRLEGTDIAFDQWVKASTGIGVSTAYLWINIAEWWDDISVHQEQVKAGIYSNGLETSLRGVRDLIRTMRQARGVGKPGSGRKAPNVGKLSVPTATKPSDLSGQDVAQHDERPAPKSGRTPKKKNLSAAKTAASPSTGDTDDGTNARSEPGGTASRSTPPPKEPDTVLGLLVKLVTVLTAARDKLGTVDWKKETPDSYRDVISDGIRLFTEINGGIPDAGA